MNMEKSWNKIATVLLKNKTIEARHMTRDEADSMGGQGLGNHAG